MIRILIWPWLLFFFILFISMFPWWFIILVIGGSAFAAIMDKRLKDKYTYHKPEDQAPDDFDPVY